MPLDRKLHVCFSVFSRQAGWSRLELGIPLLPGKLGSGEVILLRADLKNRMLWHISKSFLSLSSCQEAWWDFSPCLLWEPGRAPGGRPHKSVDSHPMTGCPAVINSHELCTLNLQQFVNYSWGFSAQVLVPREVATLVSWDSLSLPLSPILRALVCPVTSILLWI